MREVRRQRAEPAECAGRRHGVHRRPLLDDAARGGTELHRRADLRDERRARARHAPGRQCRSQLPPDRLRVFVEPRAGVSGRHRRGPRNRRRPSGGPERLSSASSSAATISDARGARRAALLLLLFAICRSRRCSPRRSRPRTAVRRARQFRPLLRHNRRLPRRSSTACRRDGQHRHLHPSRVPVRLRAHPTCMPGRACSCCRQIPLLAPSLLPAIGLV